MKPLPIQELVERLIENARLMIELSRGIPEKQQIKELQEIQERLISEIKHLSKKTPKASQDTAVIERLALFQKLNQQFIANLSVRKDLIGIDLNQLQADQEMIMTKIQTTYSLSPNRPLA